ncbi:hypothetical protein SDC9_75360 [bioreactor metagenome]|uniref:Uncharacterized protein n=1 Tax=bioreactor metagenome TaxID=1076179 RepID=A0A644YKH2_9ZZZZ
MGELHQNEGIIGDPRHQRGYADAVVLFVGKSLDILVHVIAHTRYHIGSDFAGCIGDNDSPHKPDQGQADHNRSRAQNILFSAASNRFIDQACKHCGQPQFHKHEPESSQHI